MGTGSLRRRAQLLHVRPDLQVRDIRGNVDTRLRKLHAGEYDAVVLAEAGLERLGLTGQIAQRLPLSIMLPAVGQGALGLEVRSGRPADAGNWSNRWTMRTATPRCRPSGPCWPRCAAAAWPQWPPGDALTRMTDAQLDRPGAQSRRRADDRGQPPPPGRPRPSNSAAVVADDLLAQGAAALIASSRQG